MRNPESPSPFQEAQTMRKELENAIETKTRLEIEIPNEVFSCIIGLPKNTLQKSGLNALIQTTPQGTHLLVAETEEIALEAFRNWKNGPDDKERTRFIKAQYLGIYQLIQACQHQQGKTVIEGLPGIFLSLSEEDDESIKGLSEVIKKQGTIPEVDIPLVQAYLYQLWDRLPDGIKNSIANSSPENAFKT